MSFKSILIVFGLSCVVRSTYSEGVCKSPLSAIPPDPATNCCGIQAYTSYKLFGGTTAGTDQYPWVVLIEYLTKENVTKTAGCQGVLISGQYVVTAGHCVNTKLNFGTPTNIILGEYDTSQEGPDCVSLSDGEDCTEGAIKIPIEATILHPEYKKRPTNINDIGLIKMKSVAPYTDFIRPICLPTEDVTKKTGDFSLTESSWGSLEEEQGLNHKKQFVNVPYLTKNACETLFENKFKLDKGHLCAGGKDAKAFCRGNSGSPLMNEKNNKHELVGLTSFGYSSCNLKFPTVYTNVYEYIPWIKNTISV